MSDESGEAVRPAAVQGTGAGELVLVSPDRLTLNSLQGMFNKAPLTFVPNEATGDGWVPDSGPWDDILLDLSAARFVHLRACTALVIAVGAAAAHGATIRVMLPIYERARSFVSALRFCEALSSYPGKELSVTGAGETHLKYARLFPLTWIDPSSAPSSFLSTVLAAKGKSKGVSRSLDSISVSEIVDLVVGELAENVAHHAGTALALVAAMVPESPMHMGESEVLATEAEYLQNPSSLRGAVQLCVADAGVGIVEKLRAAYPEMSDAQLLLHSFDRWSSTDDRSWKRGTRGLYRIQRAARLNDGLVTAWSGNFAVTRTNVVRPDDQSVQRVRSCFPGSFLYVELPLESPSDHRNLVLKPRGGSGLRVEVRPLATFEMEELHDFVTSIDLAEDEHLLLDASALRPTKDDAIEGLLNLAEVSHPRTFSLIGLKFNDTELEVLANDVNEEIARNSTMQAISERFEPILLVGSSFLHAYWTGTHPEFAVALHTREVPAELARFLQSTTAVRRPDAQTFATAIDHGSLWAASAELLRTEVAGIARTTAGYFITSGLIAVDRYMDVLGLLNSHVVWHGLIARLLKSELLNKHPGLRDRRLTVLCEGGVNANFARVLGEVFNPGAKDSIVVERVEPHDIESGRQLSIEPGADLLCFVSGIGGGQTLTQLLATGVRQNYRVAAAISVLDTRPVADAPVHLWGHEYDVSAVVHVPAQLDNPRGARKYLAPNGLPDRNRADAVHFGDAKRSIDALRHTRALALGHFRGVRGHHFTFAVDFDEVLADVDARTEVTTPMLAALREWHTGLDGGLQIVLSELSGEANEGAQNLTRLLLGQYNAGRDVADRLKPRRRASRGRDFAVLSIDWGAVSGTSVMDVVARAEAAHAKAVLILRGMSIVPFDLRSHLTSLRAVASGSSEVRVRVMFGISLPMSAYEPERCPLCVQSRRREADTKPPLLPLQTERRREIERLALRDMDDPALHTQGTIHGAAAVEALMRRMELAYSDTSTEAAYRVQRMVEHELRRDDYVLSLATLLMYEPQWLRRAVLSHPRTRAILGTRLAELLVPAQGAIGDRSTIRRALIGLRLVSKTLFVDSLGRILVEAVEPGDGNFELACHLASQIVERRYSGRTGLPHRLESSLITARSNLAVYSTDDDLRVLDHLLELCLAAHFNADPDGDLLQIGMKRLGLALTAFLEHPFRDPLRLLVPKTVEGEELEGVSAAWQTILATIRNRALPLIRRNRTHLRLTHQFANHQQAFDSMFPVDGELGDADRCAEIIRSAVQTGRRLSEGEVDYLQRTANQLERLFVRAPITGNEDCLLKRAVEGSVFTLGYIARVFENVCASESVAFEALLEPHVIDCEIVLADKMLIRLIDQVIANTKRHSVGKASVEMKVEVIRHEQGAELVMKLRSLNVEQAERDETKPGDGGLAEWQRSGMEHVRLTYGYIDNSGSVDFEVQVHCEKVIA